ncbi:MAG: insulinase family protein [Clostridiales bacterium]|nr:insulinase family protein [Clostridiales bacterium]
MKIELTNGIEVYYKKSKSKLNSISIGVNAGAALEDNLLGLAHITEHMVYKGTKKRSEEEINRDLSNIFGFQNAMTNYPYVIYYGSLLEEDLDKGIELFYDILKNPKFDEKDFIDEREVILQELKEWDEDLEQYCEDKLFYNCYKSNRLKYPIIGLEKDIKNTKISHVIDFYNKHYIAKNIKIAVVSSLEVEKVLKIVKKYFLQWEDSKEVTIAESTEIPKANIYFDNKMGIMNSRIQIIAPINNLINRELAALEIFNEFFGVGVNSILFTELRTKNSLVYDILTKINNEKHIRLYKIFFTTSKENVNKTLEIINNIIGSLEKTINKLSKERINELVKVIKIKKLINEEQSIFVAKDLSIKAVMKAEKINVLNIEPIEILEVFKKVFSKITIEVVNPKE